MLLKVVRLPGGKRSPDILQRIMFIKMDYYLSPYNASKAATNSLCRYMVYYIIPSNRVDLVIYRTLAQEEEDIVCVALRPGMVDTSVSMD